MKFTSRLLACSLLSLAAPTVTFAAAPAAKAAPAAAAAVEKNAKPNNLDAGKTAAAPNAAPTTNAASATPPAAVPETPPTPASGVTLDAYIKDLTSELKLSAAEAKEIEDYYADDSSALNKILNDASLSPLQQTEQVDAMRDARNDKITALLEDTVRRHAFMEMFPRLERLQRSLLLPLRRLHLPLPRQRPRLPSTSSVVFQWRRSQQ
jgi:hypothetical protein